MLMQPSTGVSDARNVQERPVCSELPRPLEHLKTIWRQDYVFFNVDDIVCQLETTAQHLPCAEVHSVVVFELPKLVTGAFYVGAYLGDLGMPRSVYLTTRVVFDPDAPRQMLQTDRAYFGRLQKRSVTIFLMRPYGSSFDA
jgi:hypothetical protein